MEELKIVEVKVQEDKRKERKEKRVIWIGRNNYFKDLFARIIKTNQSFKDKNINSISFEYGTCFQMIIDVDGESKSLKFESGKMNNMSRKCSEVIANECEQLLTRASRFNLIRQCANVWYDLFVFGYIFDAHNGAKLNYKYFDVLLQGPEARMSSILLMKSLQASLPESVIDNFKIDYRLMFETFELNKRIISVVKIKDIFGVTSNLYPITKLVYNAPTETKKTVNLFDVLKSSQSTAPKQMLIQKEEVVEEEENDADLDDLNDFA